jgi:hypothetical protein
MDHAAQYHVASVNLSFSDGGNYDQLQSMDDLGGDLATLAQDNVVVVAAAGNEHSGTTDPFGLGYPAADPNVIPVGAVWDANHGGPFSWGSDTDRTTGADRIVSFSQRLPGSGELFAPGTLLTGAAPGGGTVEQSGTSAASAVVAGAVALAQQIARDRLGRFLTTTEIRNLLQDTGKVIHDGDDEDDNVNHSGADYRRIDVLAMANAILALGSVSPARVAAARNVAVAAGDALDVDLGSALTARPAGVNHAPVLTGPGLVTLDTSGNTVGHILAGTIKDADRLAQVGMALIGTTGNGTWQYSRDGGRTWIAVGAVSAGKALLLASSDRLRFMPARGWSGKADITYRAWDLTTGKAGTRVDLSAASAVGGGTAFSKELASAAMIVTARR